MKTWKTGPWLTASWHILRAENFMTSFQGFIVHLDSPLSLPLFACLSLVKHVVGSAVMLSSMVCTQSPFQSLKKFECGETCRRQRSDAVIHGVPKVSFKALIHLSSDFFRTQNMQGHRHSTKSEKSSFSVFLRMKQLHLRKTKS